MKKCPARPDNRGHKNKKYTLLCENLWNFRLPSVLNGEVANKTTRQTRALQEFNHDDHNDSQEADGDFGSDDIFRARMGRQRKNDATTPPPPCPQGQVRSSSNPNSPCKAAAPSGPAQQQPTHSQSTGAPGSTTPTRTPTTPTRIPTTPTRIPTTPGHTPTTPTRTPTTPTRIPTTPGHTPATLGHTPSRIVRIPGDKTVEVNLRPNGKVSDYQTAGMTIHEGSRGGRTIVSEHNGRTIVSTGSDLGYVQRPYLSRKGVDYVQRTYVARGDSYTRVYRETVYRGGHYCTYVPAHYYHRVFYRWAHNPWGPGVHYNWERSYGGYFAPYPVYPTASLWLTDYLIVANLQAPYQAQADANTGPGPGRPPLLSKFRSPDWHLCPCMSPARRP